MNKSLMKQALMDDGFVSYFERTGGIRILCNPLMTRDEMIERYIATDTEWLAMPHRFLPKQLQVHTRDLEAKVKELLQTMTPAEILMMGKPMPDEDIQAQLKIRQYQRDKLWRYYVTYLHNLPPQHPAASKLHKRYPRPWHDNGLPHRQSQRLAA